MDENGIMKAEGFLRLICMGLLVSTACIVGFDTQTKLIFNTFPKKATVKDLNALWVLVMVESVAVGYNLVQLCMLLAFTSFKGNPNEVPQKLRWCCFFLDQVVTYISFAANSAAAQASLLAVTGSSHLEWLKLCSTYTRFCFQIGGGLFCGFSATLLMAVISAISAFNLFRFYSSKDFLSLKPMQRADHTTSM